jgi:hypothetical protein
VSLILKNSCKSKESKTRKGGKVRKVWMMSQKKKVEKANLNMKEATKRKPKTILMIWIKN